MTHKHLSIVLEFNYEANRYIGYCEEFPNAIATGINEIEAENSLVSLIEDLVKCPVCKSISYGRWYA